MAIAVLVAAFVGNLIGTRSLHYQNLKEDHHDDLREYVLNPWAMAAEKAAERLGAKEMSDSLHPQGVFDEERVLTPIVDPDRFWGGEGWPPRPHLWDQSKKHWPEEHREWGELKDRMGEVDADLVELVQRLDDDLLPIIRGLMRELNLSPGDVSWYAREDTDKASSEKLAFLSARQILLSLDRDQTPDLDLSSENRVLRTKDMRILNIRDAGKAPNEDWQQFKQDIEAEALTRERLAEFQSLLKEAQALQGRFETFEDDLDPHIFNKYLPGRCDYCPPPFLLPGLGRLL